jgi:hypothetical protein
VNTQNISDLDWGSWLMNLFYIGKAAWQSNKKGAEAPLINFSLAIF